MPYFIYTARDKTGKKITATEEALNKEELIEKLQAKELILIDVIEEKEGVSISSISKTKTIRQHSGIKLQDLVNFSQQLSTLLSSGVPILQSLKIIVRQVSSRRLNIILEKIISDMERGLSLHEAMGKYPKVFSELWINLIESGEASGNLADVLKRISDYLERTASFRNKIIFALFYPCILMVAGLSALLFLTIKIIPTFATIFEGFNLKLPLLTRMLILISKVIRSHFIFGIGGLIILAFLFRRFLKTKKGRKKWESFLLNFKLTGDFFRAIVVERFSSSLATLLESGVPIIYALEITQRSLGNLVVAEIIEKTKESVRQGRNLSQPLEESGFFEPMIIQMISIGEEIGDLPSMLKRVNTYYQEYVDRFLVRFTSLFEPVILLFLGGVIALMVIGMFLPIFQLTQIRG